jgi:hypothetical protein
VAIYYSRLTTVRRSRGHSATAAAAYRAGLRIEDAGTHEVHDYSRRKGVLDARMLAPPCAAWALDPRVAWDCAEAAEVRRNACVARELVVALPAELTEGENIALAERLGQDLVDWYGVAVLVAVHRPDAHGDDRNVHCHLLMSTRVAHRDGFGEKTRVLDAKETGPLEAQAMRVRVAERINAALAEAGHGARVDPRSLAAQADAAVERGDLEAVAALTRLPMKHQGRAATARARRGLESSVVKRNAAARRINADVVVAGHERAVQLRRVIDRRAVRAARASVKAAPGARRQSLRHGVGAVSTIEMATGADADVLNAQAQLVRESAQGARNAAEAYLQRLVRDADELDRAFRAYLVRTAAPAEAGALGMDSAGALVHALGARGRYERVCEVHRAAKRGRAEAEATHSRAAAAEATTVDPPPVWRPMTRRRWAEHRRRERAAVENAAADEARAGARVRRTREAVRQAKTEWREADAELRARARAHASNRGNRADNMEKTGAKGVVEADGTVFPDDFENQLRLKPKNRARKMRF